MVMSGRKGSSFERKISRELSRWITNGERDDIFWRTHSSGALGTISKKKAEYGDLMYIDDLGKPLTGQFNIECRHGKCIKVRDLVYKPASSSMVQFIEECELNAKLSNRRPLWIFREQGQPIMVMMKADDYMRGHIPNSNVKGVVHFHDDNLWLMAFEEWKRTFKV